MNKKGYCLLTGPTGVGKSSVMSCLATKISCKLYSDPYVNNPFIHDEYLKNNRCFQSQVFFFKEFLKIHKEINIEMESNFIFQERSIYESVNIFCRNLFLENKFNQDELTVMFELLSCVESYIKRPQKIIYLNASSDIIMNRIMKRGRTFECNISESFVKRQIQLYEDWIDCIAKQWKCNIIRINTNSQTIESISEMVLGYLF